jgi:hypothetical protein
MTAESPAMTAEATAMAMAMAESLASLTDRVTAETDSFRNRPFLRRERGVLGVVRNGVPILKFEINVRQLRARTFPVPLKRG